MTSEWSASEKKIARTVFETALERELAEILQRFKAMAASATGPESMWQVEEFLCRSRREINNKYDYRYSQLHWVFARLIREGRISESDLFGLSEGNMKRILQSASI